MWHRLVIHSMGSLCPMFPLCQSYIAGVNVFEVFPLFLNFTAGVNMCSRWHIVLSRKPLRPFCGLWLTMTVKWELAVGIEMVTTVPYSKKCYNNLLFWHESEASPRLYAFQFQIYLSLFATVVLWGFTRRDDFATHSDLLSNLKILFQLGFDL